MKRFFMTLFIALSVVSVAPIMQAAGSNPCGICREEVVDGTDVVALECSHIFHARCITGWDRRCLGDAACPYCSRKLRQRKDLETPRLFEHIWVADSGASATRSDELTCSHVSCCILGAAVGAAGAVAAQLGPIVAHIIISSGR